MGLIELTIAYIAGALSMLALIWLILWWGARTEPRLPQDLRKAKDNGKAEARVT
jgi:hypothetical protein